MPHPCVRALHVSFRSAGDLDGGREAQYGLCPYVPRPSGGLRPGELFRTAARRDPVFGNAAQTITQDTVAVAADKGSTMQARRPVAAALALAAGMAVLAGTGCQKIPKRPARSLLRPVQMSPDSVVVDIFFIRFPFGDPQANGDLWAEVDEQAFSPELRQRLTRNGFRAALIAGPMPATLCQLLEIPEKPPPSASHTGVTVTDLREDPKVVRRHVQVRAGQRTEIQTSGVYERLPVLVCEARGVCGQEYTDAQGVLALRADAQPDGRARLHLVPEVHYGQPRLQRIPTPGGVRLEPGRPRRAFDDLAMEAMLQPGQMIVVASLPHKPGSLGHYFFTQETSGKLEQKLMVIRLSQTQRDDLFDPQLPLPLDSLPVDAK